MANRCSEADSLYQDLPFCSGKKSLPGVRGYVFGISKRDILVYPKMPAAPASLAEKAKYVGDFVLAADKKWHRIGMIPNEGQIQVESQGTYGSKTFKCTGTIVIPGTEEEATGYISSANNDEMIYLFVQRVFRFRTVVSRL